MVIGSGLLCVIAGSIAVFGVVMVGVGMRRKPVPDESFTEVEPLPPSPPASEEDGSPQPVASTTSDESWEDFAARQGMVADDSGFTGEVRGFLVALRIHKVAQGQGYRRQTLLTVSGLPPDLEVNADPRYRSALDGMVGDDDFDGPIGVKALKAEAVGHLNHAVREILREPVKAGHLTLHRGVLVVKHEGRAVPAALEEMLDLGLAAASALAATVPVEEALVQSVRSDPLDAVKLSCLRQLVRIRHPEAAALAKLVGGERSSVLRSGAEGDWPALRAAASDPKLELRARRDAVEALLHLEDPESLAEGLDDLWRVGPPALWRWTMRAIKREKLRGARSAVCAFMERVAPEGESDDTRQAFIVAANILGGIGVGDRRSEAALHRGLSHPEQTVQLAAVRALEKVGTAISGSALAGLRERVSDTELLEAISKASAAVRARH